MNIDTENFYLPAMPQEYLNREIKEVTSSGGWTRMDYILTLK